MTQELPEAVLREIQRIARLAFEAGRSSMREEASLVCKAPKKYLGIVSSTRRTAWEECEVAIRSLP